MTRLIARELVVIAIVLFACPFFAGAASQPSGLRASANFNATGKITNQVPNGWIRSSSYDQAKGTLIIDFAKGLFSTTPNCTINPNKFANQSPPLSWDAFPQPVSAYPDGVVIIDSITPKRRAHPLSASQIVCVGQR